MIKFMLTIIHRDLLLLIRQPSETLNPLVFFLLVIALFPLGISPEATLLSKTAAGMIWVAAMLATLLSLELLFKLDHDDGSLEQLLLAPYPSWSLVLAKVFVHWLMSGLPLILISPVIASMLFLPSQGVPVLMLSLLLGTPTLQRSNNIQYEYVVRLMRHIFHIYRAGSAHRNKALYLAKSPSHASIHRTSYDALVMI